MCDFECYNIKVVEGNEFTLLLPLKRRTFVASRPVDENIVIEDLENLRVFVNNTEYSSVRKESDGVAIDFPATLKQGDYDVVLTATYHGVDIRAAYNDAVIIVAWNQQSDAQQFVQGSPFVLPAAYVLGVMTDSELKALKAQLRLEIAEAQQAKEEAEQAKEEYIAKAAALDDVAKQSTLTHGVSDIREDISHIDIDTSNLAKQGRDAGATLTDTQTAAVQAASDAAAAKTASQDAKTLIGQPAIGQPGDLFAAIGALGADQLKVQECYSIAAEKHATMPQYRTIENLPATIGTINATRLSEIPVSALTLYPAQTIVDYKGILFYGFPDNTGAIEVYNLKGSGGLADKGVASVTKIQFADWTGSPSYFRCNNLNWVDATGFHMPSHISITSFTNNPGLIRTLIGDHTLEEVLNGLTVFDGTATSQTFWQSATSLRREDFRAMINGLADLTGKTAQTLTIGSKNLRKLTADDIAVATDKNWTLA